MLSRRTSRSLVFLYVAESRATEGKSSYASKTSVSSSPVLVLRPLISTRLPELPSFPSVSPIIGCAMSLAKSVTTLFPAVTCAPGPSSSSVILLFPLIRLARKLPVADRTNSAVFVVKCTPSSDPWTRMAESAGVYVSFASGFLQPASTDNTAPTGSSQRNFLAPIPNGLHRTARKSSPRFRDTPSLTLGLAIPGHRFPTAPVPDNPSRGNTRPVSRAIENSCYTSPALVPRQFQIGFGLGIL